MKKLVVYMVLDICSIQNVARRVFKSKSKINPAMIACDCFYYKKIEGISTRFGVINRKGIINSNIIEIWVDADTDVKVEILKNPKKYGWIEIKE
ncbi:MAG: hypothetical protein PHT40_04225 [Patescibacteria group bacterium]|nr:hypothetical protein [Patescibacteria group bacterium]